MVNKQSVSPPIPHLHALLTSGDDPPEEVDIFDLLKVSYEVSTGQAVPLVPVVRVALCSVALPRLTESPLAHRDSAA